MDINLQSQGVPEMNLTTPKAILVGLLLIALATLFQPTITRLLTPPAQAQSPVRLVDHEMLKADHEMLKTSLGNIQYAIEHIPGCKQSG
jgi:hypothetical protein